MFDIEDAQSGYSSYPRACEIRGRLAFSVLVISKGWKMLDSIGISLFTCWDHMTMNVNKTI